MRNAIAILLLIFAVLASPGALAGEETPYAFPIKELHAAPLADSAITYNIPVEVKLLDVSGDWYKVKISYGIGPLQYNYVGWTHIPLR
ncbi:MAG: hypothetical protein HQ596_05045 [Candidatus Saganbacteria bacterium]|nr:hypothetical protein [Candidatus Saganbacteria bacterium]